MPLWHKQKENRTSDPVMSFLSVWSSHPELHPLWRLVPVGADAQRNCVHAHFPESGGLLARPAGEWTHQQVCNWRLLTNKVKSASVFQSLLGNLDSAVRTFQNYYSVWRQFGGLPEFYSIPQGYTVDKREGYPLRPGQSTNTPRLSRSLLGVKGYSRSSFRLIFISFREWWEALSCLIFSVLRWSELNSRWVMLSEWTTTQSFRPIIFIV